MEQLPNKLSVSPRIFEFTIWQLFGASVWYALISLVLFILTTNGWGFVFVPIYVGGFFLLVLLALLIANFMIGAKGQNILRISAHKFTRYMQLLSLLQFVLLLLNPNHVGDGGVANFIQRLVPLLRFPQDKYGEMTLLVPGEIVELLYIAYFLACTLLLYFILQRQHRHSERITKDDKGFWGNP